MISNYHSDNDIINIADYNFETMKKFGYIGKDKQLTVLRRMEKYCRNREIIDILQTEFEVTPEQCEAEVRKFLGKMVKSKVILKE